MKKSYIIPQSETIIFAMQEMLAASPDPITNVGVDGTDSEYVTGDNMGTNGADWDDNWDDIED